MSLLVQHAAMQTNGDGDAAAAAAAAAAAGGGGSDAGDIDRDACSSGCSCTPHTAKPVLNKNAELLRSMTGCVYLPKCYINSEREGRDARYAASELRYETRCAACVQRDEDVIIQGGKEQGSIRKEGQPGYAGCHVTISA